MIESAAIIGMGALGLLFGEPMAEFLGPDRFSFVMDPVRCRRHKDDVYTINGRTVRFPVRSTDQVKEPVDLVLVAVKGPDLESAVRTMAPCVGRNTILLSLMNGISSEEILGARFGREKVLYEVSQEMDAQRYGTALTYTKRGRILLGVPKDADPQTGKSLDAALEEVCAFFDRAKVPYAREADILYRQWSKWMLNVGCNQVCMVFDQGYGPCMEEGSLPFALMTGAMREVCALAEKEGIPVGEKEVEEYLAIRCGALHGPGQKTAQKVRGGALCRDRVKARKGTWRGDAGQRLHVPKGAGDRGGLFFINYMKKRRPFKGCFIVINVVFVPMMIMPEL